VCETPRELSINCDIIIIMVWDLSALRDVTLGPEGLLEGAHEGQVVVDMSTQAPKTALWEQELYAQKGVSFLDAPVHGTKAEVNAGGLWIMVGGERTAFERMKPVFGVLGETLHYMGPAGSGFATKMCGQLYVSSLVAALAEALVCASKAGIDVREALKLWGESDFRSPLLEGFGNAVLERDFSVSFHLRTMVKDTNLVKEFAEDLGMPVFIPSIVHEMFKVGVNKGFGEENASAIVKVLEDMAKAKVE
jgi:3-hydroxyisobutyrate dehydrogenase-like beta-hydroxyacid dehydrogenase